MAPYDISFEPLPLKYPAFGHALWESNARKSDMPIQVGDVGVIRRAKFYRVFNALLPANDPSHVLGVPEYHGPLVPSLLDHIYNGSLSLIIVVRPGSAWKLTRAIILLSK